jgi:cobalt-zinc-cadmium efflux system protein
MSTMHEHGPSSGHLHRSEVADRRPLGAALGLLLGFVVAEIVVGAVAGSLALVADAGHMATDAAALALALFAAWAATRPARGPWTYGFGRVEILAAQVNGIALLLFAAWIVIEAVRRLVDPTDVDAVLVLPVAVAGIVVNLAVLWLLSRAKRQSLNLRGAYLHIATDVAAFAGTSVAAALILVTGWDRFDPLASLLVAGLMLWASWSLLRASARIFLEGAPESASPDDVGRSIAAHPGVVEAHDLHIWTVTSGFPALSAHVLVENGADCHRIRLALERLLHDRFAIDHTTLQVEHIGAAAGLEIRRSSG